MNIASLTKFIILHLIAILLVIFNISDIRASGISSFIPMFDVMMVFYFAVYKKEVFVLWFLFLLGIWSDALNGFPLGITSACYILITKFFNVLNQRLMIKENFKQILEQFIAFAFTILAVKWVALSIYYSTAYNVVGPLIQLAVSSILYVIMHKVFDYLAQKLLDGKAGA